MLITLSISEHPDFRREGSNLRVHVPVPLKTAVLGGGNTRPHHGWCGGR